MPQMEQRRRTRWRSEPGRLSQAAAAVAVVAGTVQQLHGKQVVKYSRSLHMGLQVLKLMSPLGCLLAGAIQSTLLVMWTKPLQRAMPRAFRAVLPLSLVVWGEAVGGGGAWCLGWEGTTVAPCGSSHCLLEAVR